MSTIESKVKIKFVTVMKCGRPAHARSFAIWKSTGNSFTFVYGDFAVIYSRTYEKLLENNTKLIFFENFEKF